MNLTILGCSGSVPGPATPASGYLLEAEGYHLVLDLGHGAFGELQRYVDPADVDAIVISHLHADHMIDLTAYIVALRFGGAGFRQGARRIPLIGPAGTRDRLEAAYDPLARKLGLHELFGFSTPSDGMQLGPFSLSFTPTQHPVPTTAVRIAHGDAALVYSADSGPSPALVELARGADAFLCEASFAPEDEYVPNLHLTGLQAGEHAAQAEVGKLIITHVPPWASAEVQASEAAKAYSGPIEIARPGAVFAI